MFSQYEVLSLTKDMKALGVKHFKVGDLEVVFVPEKVELAEAESPNESIRCAF